jgi:hypothetical protein
VREISGDAVSPDSSFPATIVLENSSSSSIDVTLDPGSNIWCTNEEAQNLIIVYSYTITVPAGSTETGTMPTYCLNSSLDAPDGDDSFVLGTVYTDGCIGEIITILSSKNTSSFDYSHQLTVQLAIWECLDEGSLSTATIDDLNNLP